MRTIKRGSRGDEVMRLQSLLGITADEIFGPATEQAVKDFQRLNGLTVDGIVGPATWAALGVESEDVTVPTESIKQYAKPHGPMTYGPDKTYSTYRSGGCGVASFAIVQRAYGLCPDGETATETVQRLGRYSWEHGFRPKGQGTRAGLFSTNGCKAVSTLKPAAIEAALRSGKLVILLIKKGFDNGYTGTGHYIVAYGIKDGKLLLRDVGASAARRQWAKLSTLPTGLKSAYIISKEV